MKKTLLFLLSSIILSCSSNEKLVDDQGENQSEKKLYVSKIISTSSQSTTELNFTYDSENKLIKNETDSYFREYIYDNNNRIVQIKSITKPNTLYYTVNFIYDSQGNIVEVKRDNHHNSTIFYIKYDYYNTGEVNNVYVFESIDSYNENKHDRYYDLSGYQLSTNNFTGKYLFVYQTTNDWYDVYEEETRFYDINKRPFFGEILKEVQLPYSTDGTGLDWDITYSTNNPTKVSVFDFNSGLSFDRRVYEYEYNEEELPTKMIKKTYFSNGNLASTFTQEFSYSLR